MRCIHKMQTATDWSQLCHECQERTVRRRNRFMRGNQSCASKRCEASRFMRGNQRDSDMHPKDARQTASCGAIRETVICIQKMRGLIDASEPLHCFLGDVVISVKKELLL